MRSLACHPLPLRACVLFVRCNCVLFRLLRMSKIPRFVLGADFWWQLVVDAEKHVETQVGLKDVEYPTQLRIHHPSSVPTAAHSFAAKVLILGNRINCAMKRVIENCNFAANDKK